MNMDNKNIEGLVVRSVGESTVSVISRLDVIGNSVVRACEVFSDMKKNQGNEQAVKFCREACPIRDLSVKEYRVSDGLDCPEKNTLDAYRRLGVSPEQALTVAVTGNRVGFSDEFDIYKGEGLASVNPEGWREAKGFNAFFVDTSEGTVALGRRLADCGDLNIEFKTKDKRTIIGFMHLTRPNQTVGKGKYKFGKSEDPQSYFEYALEQALEHFGEVDLSSVSISLRTAIEAKNFVKRFGSDQVMEEHLPGWYDDGYLENVSNPEWKSGDPHNPEDVWHADFKGLILRDINQGMEHLGIAHENLDTEGMVDTMGDKKHSSYERATRNNTLDTRDLYITALMD